MEKSKFVYQESVEKWDVLEVVVPGTSDGNPFTDVEVLGTFRHSCEEKTIHGFYDGEGRYVIRFMPSFTGSYSFSVQGSFSDLVYEGTFTVTPPSSDNHGPVRVANTAHFAYEDGTPYYQIGTTCYVWTLQNEKLQEKTLDSLRAGPFNKIRFCVFPKHYDYNLHEPISYPYEGTPVDSSGLTRENFSKFNSRTPGNDWDFFRFNPQHFQHMEKRICDLRDLGIEADIIVMHPYDRWGFSAMSAEADDLYWKYVIARFAAYRNVWFSLANEYDLMRDKTIRDWERYAGIICERDPYNRLRSIHNCMPFYNHHRPWISHCSIQREDVYKTAELTDTWRETYHKPIVLDEIVYEGNIQHGWGNISGQEMTRRFWEATCRGGYAGHGETYLNDENILWWSHGGALHGTSPARLAFLKTILHQTPGLGLKTLKRGWDEVVAVEDKAVFSGSYSYYLFYYGFNRPSFRDFYFDDHNPYRVEVIDTWEMTIEDRGLHTGRFSVTLPGKEYMAIRIRRESGTES